MNRFSIVAATWMLVFTAVMDLRSQVSAVCTAPRVRKAWGAMTASEQQLYVDAVELGMQKGYHILFTELHSEAQSSTEFYRTCGFLYWNRRFLLAYENMLRSLGPQYECVTIPYWDYFADYSRFLVGDCINNGTSIEACSPILRGLGASSGAVQNVTINGQVINGGCVSAGFGKSFCESSAITNKSQCAKCIPRGNWGSTTFPSGFGYAGLAVLLGKSNGFRVFSNALQYGIHNTIHNTLSSTMATYMGPADPVFMNHHATVDMLHQIYLECNLGDDVTAKSSQHSRFAYQKCSYSGEKCPDLTSSVTQLWRVSKNLPSSRAAIPAERQSKLKAFFTPIPIKYGDLISIKDLGALSYTYQLDQLLQNLESHDFVCPSKAAKNNGNSPPPKMRKLQDLEVAPTATPTLPTTSTDLSISTIDTGASQATATSNTVSTAGVAMTNFTEPAPAAASGINTDFPAAQAERDFVQDQSLDFVAASVEAATSVDGTVQTAFEQTEVIECLFHDEITDGGVQDYSDYFRRNFQLDDHTHPRCFDLLQNGEGSSVRVANWESIARRYYRRGSGTARTRGGNPRWH